MHEDYSTIARAQERRSWRANALLGVGAGAFLLGAALVGLMWWSGLAPGEFLQVKHAQPATLAGAPLPTPSASASEATAARQAVAQVQQVVQQQGGLDSRVAAMEQRLSKLDLQLQAASGNAARTEGLLVAFAARRAIERGEPLGYLTDQLQLRFGEAHPNSVRTVVDFSRAPVTLDQLVARLQGLAPDLVKAPKSEGALTWIGREISGLFVIRRETTPSPEPQRRLDRAQLFLESGRVDPAIAEVRNLPNAQEAADWIADAQRYAAARQALDMLEQTAILDSRDLRDSSGQPVQQPSPAAGNP
ncbi:MAG: hypothetical protein J2O44_02950 [Porphyrobacter sp.]|nr:hypothetical protein [Porphyrobacter sp.]